METISKISHVMVVFNSSVNFYVYYLKDKHIRTTNNLIRIKTIDKQDKTAERRSESKPNLITETETRPEFTSLVNSCDS